MSDRKSLPIALCTLFGLTLGVSACGDDGSSSGDTDGGSGSTGGTPGSSGADDSSGSVESETDGGPGVEAARMLFEPIVRAQCERLFGCCDAEELAFRVGPSVADADDCTGRVLDMMEVGMNPPSFGLASVQLADYLPFFAYGLDGGVVEVNEDGFAGCASQISGAACPAAADAVGSCTPVEEIELDACHVTELFSGKQSVGEDCSLYQSIECESGLVCDIFGASVGVCVESLGVGDPCFADHNCSSSLLCDYASGRCIEAASEGDACEYPDPQNPLFGTETVRCEASLACDPLSNTCQAAQCGFGSYCGGDDDGCADGLSCVAGRCDLLAEAGEECWDDDDCGEGRCQYVGFGSICQGLVAQGDPCAQHDQCATGFCDPAGPECADQIDAGDPCDPGAPAEQCDAGYCNGADCVAFGDLGDACPPEECNWLEGQNCVDGECVGFPYPDGASCSSNGQCESGHCSGVCMAPLEIGDNCVVGSAACGDAAYCRAKQDSTTEGKCRARLGEGAACVTHLECWNGCELSFGELRCRGAGPGAIACDGE